jgi:hypothetical protein
MPIIYSLVTRRSNVLAERTSGGVTGNFANVTRLLLKVSEFSLFLFYSWFLFAFQKIPAEDTKLSYIYDK